MQVDYGLGIVIRIDYFMDSNSENSSDHNDKWHRSCHSLDSRPSASAVLSLAVAPARDPPLAAAPGRARPHARLALARARISGMERGNFGRKSLWVFLCPADGTHWLSCWLAGGGCPQGIFKLLTRL